MCPHFKMCVCEHIFTLLLWCTGGGQRKLGVLVFAFHLVCDGLLATVYARLGDLGIILDIKPLSPISYGLQLLSPVGILCAGSED